MTFDLQNLIVLAIVAAAATYLLRSVRRSLVKRAAGCGTCATCPSGTKAASEPMVVELGGPQRDSAH